MRGYVDTDWGQLHYRQSGPATSEGAPVVVLFHESPRSSLVYEPIMATLGESVTAVAFDTPGFGQSDSAPAGADLSEYAVILLQAIDALGIGAFTPVGMKTGSSIAIAVATAADPARVNAAVLYGTDLPDAERSERYALTWAPALEIPADGSLFARLWAKNVGIYGDDSPRDLAVTVAETVLNIDRYNSIYPTVFRSSTITHANMLALRDRGVAITFIYPPEAHMTPDEVLSFVRIEGTTSITMPVTGQFASRAPEPFVAAILAAAATATAATASVTA